MTVSIFRAAKNPELFDEMEKDGTLIKDAISGIYHVKGYTNLPFQIVITGELEGEGYAAYRALTDRADAADVERIIEDVGKEKDDVVKEHYRVLLLLVAARNPQLMETIRKGDTMSQEEMENVLMEIMKDKVDEQVSEGKREQEQQTTVTHIKDIMESFGVTIEKAMDSLKIPQSQRSIYAGLVGKQMS